MMIDPLELKKYFSTTDIFKIFEVDENASEAEVTKAYKKLCLRFHPDRVHDLKMKEESTQKFILITKIHQILKNTSSKDFYLRNGHMEDFDDTDLDVYNYFKEVLMPQRLTDKDIDEFEKKFKGSLEEVELLKESYIKYEGNMNKIVDSIYFSTPEDISRYTELIEAMIDIKELEEYPKFKEGVSKSKINLMKRKAAAVIKNNSPSLGDILKTSRAKNESQMHNLLKNVVNVVKKSKQKKQK
ncbi:MAG: DnaJ subfamily C member 9 [Paramarteilia canceri]